MLGGRFLFRQLAQPFGRKAVNGMDWSDRRRADPRPNGSPHPGQRPAAGCINTSESLNIHLCETDSKLNQNTSWPKDFDSR